MIARDFQYDGEYLRNHGFIICNTDQRSGFETIGEDSKLNFNKTSLLYGKRFDLTTAEYADKLDITFQICKCPDSPDCNPPIAPITSYDFRSLKRWLNRPQFHKFKLIQPEWENLYMEGSFNITDQLGFDGKLYILELTFTSNRPFALHEPITHRITTANKNEPYTLIDISDEIGYIYPDVQITCLEAGDLRITNANENRITEVKNCSEGEILTFSKELLLSSSLPTHKIQNDFNYTFFRIANSYHNRKNALTFSIPVKMKITYSPYAKVVF